MKKTILLLTILLLTFTVTAQVKRDSIKFDSNEVKTIYRNSLIIQQNLHQLHIDGILRDKLDSIYQQSAIIFENKLKAKPAKAKTASKN
jgi:hypothetical protein